MASTNEKLFSAACKALDIYSEQKVESRKQFTTLVNNMLPNSAVVISEIPMKVFVSKGVFDKTWRKYTAFDLRDMAAERARTYYCLSQYDRSRVETPNPYMMHCDFVLVTKNGAGIVHYHPIETNGFFHENCVGRKTAFNKQLVTDALKDLCFNAWGSKILWLRCDEQANQVEGFLEDLKCLLRSDEISMNSIS